MSAHPVQHLLQAIIVFKQMSELHLCGLTEANGSWLQAIELVQVAIYGKVADEVVHLVVLLCYPGLFRNYGLRRVEAVVHLPDALAVTNREPCAYM